MDRERERKIVEQGRAQGKSDEFIKQAVLRDRERRNMQKSVMPQPVQEEPGLLKSIVMGTGIPRFAANVARVGQATADLGRAIVGKQPIHTQEELAKPVNMPWLGQVKPVGLTGTVGEKARDIIGETAKVVATFAPVPKWVGGVYKATLGGKIVQGVKTGVVAGAEGGALYGFGEGIQDPNATVGSVVANTAVNAAIGGAGGGILGGVFPLAGAGFRSVTKPKTQRVSQDIVEYFEKGVKPNLPGKTTPTTRTQFNNKIVEGVQVINNNKAGLQFVDDTGELVTGRAPRTLKEFSDAIEQTKSRVYAQYDDLATRAGENGVTVDPLPIANELDQVIDNKALQLSHPEAVRYAQEVQNRFRRAGPLDAKTAQDVIKNYNNSLQAFYRNPTPEGLTRNAVDAMMVNRIRKALDDGIEGLTGAQYQALKNQYGALKTIERDVMRATLRDARKNMKGLIDYTDIFSGGQVVNGILSMNPGTVASGLTQKAIATYFKYLNNPNRAIMQMFQAADNIKAPTPSIPLSTRKALPAPAPGAPSVQVDVPINLSARTSTAKDILERGNPNIKKPNNAPRRSVSTEFPRTYKEYPQSNQLPANTLRATSPIMSAKKNSVIPTTKPQPQGKAIPQSTGQLFAGGAAGFEIDENGKVSFNSDKALMGMAAMVGAQKLPKAELLKKLRTSLPNQTKTEMADFVATIKSGAVKTGKDGTLQFASKADERVFDAGLAIVNDRPMLRKFANDSLAKIANLYDEVLDYGGK